MIWLLQELCAIFLLVNKRQGTVIDVHLVGHKDLQFVDRYNVHPSDVSC